VFVSEKIDSQRRLDVIKQKEHADSGQQDNQNRDSANPHAASQGAHERGGRGLKAIKPVGCRENLTINLRRILDQQGLNPLHLRLTDGGSDGVIQRFRRHGFRQTAEQVAVIECLDHAALIGSVGHQDDLEFGMGKTQGAAIRQAVFRIRKVPDDGHGNRVLRKDAARLFEGGRNPAIVFETKLSQYRLEPRRIRPA